MIIYSSTPKERIIIQKINFPLGDINSSVATEKFFIILYISDDENSGSVNTILL